MYVPEYELKLAEGDRARRDGQLSAAEAAYHAALAIAEQDPTPAGPAYRIRHLAAAEVLCKLGRLYETMGRGLDATLSFRKGLRIFSSISGDEYFQLAVARDRRAVG